MTDRQGDAERPSLLLLTPGGWGGETDLIATISTLARETDYVFDHMALAPDDDALADHLARPNGVTITYGTAAESVLGGSATTRFMALLHPSGETRPQRSDLAGADILVTAGATDTAAPAEMIGILADMLDDAGAKTDVHWNRGGGEITPEETARLKAWLGVTRASFVDPGTLPIIPEDQGAKGRYVINLPGGLFAEMTYSKASDSLIIIDHTDVPDALRGTGTGMRLLQRLLTDARAGGRKIIPLCPFAAAQFKRHPEWADLLETRVRMKPKSQPSGH